MGLKNVRGENWVQKYMGSKKRLVQKTMSYKKLGCHKILDDKKSCTQKSQSKQFGKNLVRQRGYIAVHTNTPRTNVALTNVALTNVAMTVGICLRCSQEPTFKVS